MTDKIKNPKGAGRKPLPESEKMKMVSFRLKPNDVEKLKELGGIKFIKEMLNKYN